MSNVTGLLPFLNTRLPADLGPGPRPEADSESSLNSRLRQSPDWLSLTPGAQELTRALILLWHDHLDAAHTIAQAVDNADGAYVHAIIHRREPDFGNAAYWFRRVGRHRAFPQLASRAQDLIQSAEDQRLEQRLLPAGEWDPFRFVDACEQAARGELSPPETRRLVELQRLEFEVLLGTLAE